MINHWAQFVLSMYSWRSGGNYLNCAQLIRSTDMKTLTLSSIIVFLIKWSISDFFLMQLLVGEDIKHEKKNMLKFISIPSHYNIRTGYENREIKFIHPHSYIWGFWYEYRCFIIVKNNISPKFVLQRQCRNCNISKWKSMHLNILLKYIVWFLNR